MPEKLKKKILHIRIPEKERKYTQSFEKEKRIKWRYISMPEHLKSRCR